MLFAPAESYAELMHKINSRGEYSNSFLVCLNEMISWTNSAEFSTCRWCYEKCDSFDDRFLVKNRFVNEML